MFSGYIVDVTVNNVETPRALDVSSSGKWEIKEYKKPNMFCDLTHHIPSENHQALLLREMHQQGAYGFPSCISCYWQTYVHELDMGGGRG